MVLISRNRRTPHPHPSSRTRTRVEVTTLTTSGMWIPWRASRCLSGPAPRSS